MTQKPQHTPGPWAYKKKMINETDGRYLVGPQEGLLQENLLNPETLSTMLFFTSQGGYDYCHPHRRAEANASLIAAAPDMLETLEKVERWASGYGTATQSEMRQWVRTAIKKAKGE